MEPTKTHGNNSKLENLPEQLIHYLMHFLSNKDATKLSVLSKDFYSHWLSFPVLDFNYEFFRLNNNSTETFFSFIRRSTELCGPHIAGSLQKLIFSYHEEIQSTKLYPYRTAFDSLLHFAVQNNCKEIIFDVGITFYYLIILQDRSVMNKKNVSYDKLLPLFSSKFLKVLKLTGLKFSPIDAFIRCQKLEELLINSCEGFQTINISSPSLEKVEVKCCKGLKAFEVEGERLESFMFEGVRTNNGLQPCDVNLPICDSLKYLHLTEVKVLAEDINKVVTEFLYLVRCDLPENLQIFNPHIKVLEMERNNKVENLVLYTLNIERFMFEASEEPPCTLNISACLALRILKLMEVTTITDEWFKNVIPRFVCLKELELVNCIMLQKMDFRTVNLEKISLYGCYNLREATIDSPNLLDFNYFGGLAFSPLLIFSAKCSGNLSLQRNTPDHFLWFENLIQFLRYFDYFNELTFSCHVAENMIFPREFVRPNKLPPLYNVKHISFQGIYTPSKEAVTKLVDCLLWLVPKPQSLTLSFLGKGKTTALKFGYGRRLKARKAAEECCSGLPLKCWKHFDVRVQYEGFDHNDKPMKQALKKFFAPYVRYYGV